MGDWHDFFVTAAQAAAALAGLIFVGVSINLEMIMANPRYGLAGRALEALVYIGGRAHSDLPAVSTGAGDGGGGVSGAGGSDRRLGGYRGHPVAPAEELALTGDYPPSVLRDTCSTGAGSYATVGGRGDRSAELGCERAVFAGSRCDSIVPGGGGQCVDLTSRDSTVR